MKIDRQAVYKKFDGRCAYCGDFIEFEEMQIDHLCPKRNNGENNPDNLMPSCRLCNHYKRANSIETFRGLLLDMRRKLENIYIFRVARKFGMIRWREWYGEFYFELAKGEKHDMD